MENAAVGTLPCFLEWDIHNPFLPRRRMEATFYSCAEQLRQWQVTLQPMDQGHRSCRFAVSLKCDNSVYESTLARRVLVEVSVNGEIVARGEVSNFSFEDQNGYTFFFETIAVMHPVPHLNIRLEMDLPKPACRPPSSFVLNDADQEWLSGDLNRLLADPRYSNMQLVPAEEGARPIRVHSCIIAARWDKFFEHHHLYENIEEDTTVETNISEDLLLGIVTYMYSGTLRSALMEANFVAELFFMINWYKIYHLYNVFAKHDSQQRRETRRDLSASECTFPLNGVNGEWRDNLSYSWHVQPNTAYESRFRIKIRMNENDPWLSYSLKSASPREMHAQVQLEFVQTVRGRTDERAEPVHSCDYYLPPGESVEYGDYLPPVEPAESGKVHFVDDREIFHRFSPADPLGPLGRRIRYSIRCILLLSDGTSVMQVRNMLDNTLQNDMERFKVLGEHMHELLIRRSESDLYVRFPTEISGHPGHYIHKAIFATRVPSYWRVLRNVPTRGDIPEDVTCTSRGDVFHHVLFYIYTGKILAYPLPYLDQVRRFAEQGEFEALLSLVDRMSNRHTN